MTGGGKRGKPKSRFPTLPTALGNPQEQRIPTFHTATTAGDRLKAPPNPQHPKVGQIKPPKWAKRSCQTHPKPENLPWLHEQVWQSLYRSLRVATVFAVCDIDKYPNAVCELYTEIRRLMESFRGRPTKVEISGVLAETARLRENRLSWLRIAQRLCRDRSPNHICDRKCADRIRVATQSLAKAK